MAMMVWRLNSGRILEGAYAFAKEIQLGLALIVQLFDLSCCHEIIDTDFVGDRDYSFLFFLGRWKDCT